MPDMNTNQKKRLIIIGAGLSGLYLASLLQNHYEITILEASERIGGRVLTTNGHDLGPSWVWPHHKDVIALIQENGLELFEQYVKGDALYETPSQCQRFTPPPAMPSMRIKGGIIALVNAIHQKLDNVSIIYNAPVKNITQTSDHLDVRTSEGEYQADKVVVTAAPRIGANIVYSPPLSQQTLQTLQTTHTWMGNARKVVITYEKSFWRDMGYSGFVFSAMGVCSEYHDACIEDEAALFGFVRTGVDDTDIEEKVISQLVHIFGEEAKNYRHFYDKNWRKESYISTPNDLTMRQHPQYGHSLIEMDEKLYFSSTEAAYDEGGYLDGAIKNAKLISAKL